MRSLLFVVILLISLLPSAAQAEKIRVASISFRPQKLGLSQNADRLEALFREAAAQGAQLALAPEGALDGYVINEINAGHLTVEALDAVALEIDSPMIQRFQALAKELGLCLAFGFVERIGDAPLKGGLLFRRACCLWGAFNGTAGQTARDHYCGLVCFVCFRGTKFTLY